MRPLRRPGNGTRFLRLGLDSKSRKSGHAWAPEGAEKPAEGKASLGEREPPCQSHDVIPIQGRMPKVCRKHSPSLGISWLGAPPSTAAPVARPCLNHGTHPAAPWPSKEDPHDLLKRPSPPHHTSIKSPAAHSFANTFLCRKTALPFRPSTLSPTQPPLPIPLLSIPLLKTNAAIRPHAPHPARCI